MERFIEMGHENGVPRLFCPRRYIYRPKSKKPSQIWAPLRLRPRPPAPGCGGDVVAGFGAAVLSGAPTAAFDGADGAVMCAAVADYTPEHYTGHKLKKDDGGLVIHLQRTKDIAAELGRRKAGRILVGFALETDNEEAHAQEKLRRKQFDFVVLNSLRDAGAGFRGDTNKVTFIDAAGSEALPLLTKGEVAQRIADKIERLIQK